MHKYILAILSFFGLAANNARKNTPAPDKISIQRSAQTSTTAPHATIMAKIKSILDPGKRITLHATLERAELSPRVYHAGIEQALHGGAFGDALGNPVEFSTKQSETSNFSQFKQLRMISGPEDVVALSYAGHEPGKPCPVTDDTIMSEIVFETVASNKHKDPAAIMGALAEAYISNYQTSGYSWADRFRSPGTACIEAIEKLSRITPHQKKDNPYWWATAVGHKPGHEGGCGSIIRAAPFGWVFYNDITTAARLAALQSLITHGDSCSIASCAAFAAATSAGLQGYTFEQILDIAQQAATLFNGGKKHEHADWKASPFKTATPYIAEEIAAVKAQHTLGKLKDQANLYKWYNTHSSFGAPGFLTSALATMSHALTRAEELKPNQIILLAINAPTTKNMTIDRDSLGSGIGQLINVIKPFIETAPFRPKGNPAIEKSQERDNLINSRLHDLLHI